MYDPKENLGDKFIRSVKILTIASNDYVPTFVWEIVNRAEAERTGLIPGSWQRINALAEYYAATHPGSAPTGGRRISPSGSDEGGGPAKKPKGRKLLISQAPVLQSTSLPKVTLGQDRYKGRVPATLT
jgi:hypothetical protein